MGVRTRPGGIHYSPKAKIYHRSGSPRKSRHEVTSVPLALNLSDGSHPETPAQRHLLRPRTQGERPLLRPQTRAGKAVECEPHLHTKFWIYDLRSNLHFTLKENTLKRSDLDDFVTCYNPKNRHDRNPTWSEENPQGRWRAYDYDELLKRDKANLDIFWLKDESLEDSANLPDPDVLALEIVEDLEAALAQFGEIATDLKR